MAEKKEGVYSKYIPKIKDVIYIAAMVIAFGGWVMSQSNNKVLLKTTVDAHTEVIKELEEFSHEQAVTNARLLLLIEHILEKN